MTATPLDIDSEQETQGLKFKLLGPQFVSGDDGSAAGTSASYSGFSAFSSVYFLVDVSLRQGYREHPLTVTVEHSDDELSWSTAHAFSFSSDGSPSVTVSSPKDFVRVLWSAGVGSEWSIVSVVAVAPTTSNGGSQPSATDGTTTITAVSSIHLPEGTLTDLGGGEAGIAIQTRLIGPFPIAWNTPNIVDVGTPLATIAAGTLVLAVPIFPTSPWDGGVSTTFISTAASLGSRFLGIFDIYNADLASVEAVRAAGVSVGASIGATLGNEFHIGNALEDCSLSITITTDELGTSGSADVYALIATPAA